MKVLSSPCYFTVAYMNRAVNTRGGKGTIGHPIMAPPLFAGAGSKNYDYISERANFFCVEREKSEQAFGQ